MVMKKHIRSFVLFVLSIFLFTGSSIKVSGQTSGYNISDYKNPTYRYQFLNTQFNLGSSTNNQRFGTSLSNYNLKQRSISFNSSINADYLLLMNSASYQGEQNGSVDFMGNSYGGSSDGSYDGHSRSIRQYTRINLSSSNRYYFKSPYYLEFSPTLLWSNNWNNEHYWTSGNEVQAESDFKRKDIERDFAGSLGLAIGTGRIEMVQDAQMASYILEDLNKLGSLKRNISADDIEALAIAITKAKTTRFFDSRIQKIKEISEIDALLSSRGLKSSGDAAYFTSLYDNWEYSNNPVRESGHRYFVGLGFNTYNKNKFYMQDSLSPADYHYKTKNAVRQNDASIYVGFKHEKPINLKWQRSLSGQIDFSYDFSKETNQQLKPVEMDEFITEETNGPSLNANIGGSYGYYPTTRTYATASLYYYVHYGTFDVNSHYSSNSYSGSSEFWTHLQLNARVNYYCSERLRLQLSTGEFIYMQSINDGKAIDSGNEGTDYKRMTMQWNISAVLIYSFL